MKLLPTYAKTDAGLIVRDGYFNPSTGIRYAVLEGQADKGGEPEIQWVTVWSVVAYINAGDEPMAYLSVDYPTVDEALAELDRIAALIGGAVPAHGWVKGAPPLTPMAYFVAQDETGAPLVVQCVAPSETHPWANGFGSVCAPDELTHHMPTPIVAPKES